MKTKILTLFGFALIFAACSTVKETRPVQWRPLLGVDATNNWRTFRATGFSQRGWTLEDGVLHLSPGGKGGDLISVETFENFEFAWEWKVAPRANNGIKYLVTESRPSTPGHEYQMVDDATMPNLKHKTATFYDVLPVQIPEKSNPVGEWNQSRLIVQGNHIEHWLNDVRVLEYELGSDAVKTALANSKFKDAPGFGDKINGHLLLTNHKDEAWYRNLRIRELPAK